MYAFAARCPALHCRSVLLLQDKTPIGRIEEVFGPVTEPLYALRYAGPQPPPADLAKDARVFFTDALAQLVEDDVYTTGGFDLVQVGVEERRLACGWLNSRV